MIAFTARYVFAAPELTASSWPRLLLGLLLLPFALLLMPVALLLPATAAAKRRTDLIARVKRGDVTFADAIRQLEARQ